MGGFDITTLLKDPMFSSGLMMLLNNQPQKLGQDNGNAMLKILMQHGGLFSQLGQQQPQGQGTFNGLRY